MTEPEKNDWPEEDGVEVDLSDPKLEKRKSAFLFLPAGIFTSVSFWNIYRLRDIIRSVSLHLKGNGPCVWTARKHAGYIPGQRIFH